MDLNQLKEYLPFILPLVIAEIALAITALVHVLRHPHYRFGNKVAWCIIVLVIGIFGPLVYFLWGRGEEE